MENPLWRPVMGKSRKKKNADIVNKTLQCQLSNCMISPTRTKYGTTWVVHTSAHSCHRSMVVRRPNAALTFIDQL